MRLSAFLLDDEPLAIKRLSRLLADTGRVEIAGSATDPEDALVSVPRLRLDVLFLDVQMPGLNGFEFLARLREPPPVIFTTAYDAYALQAFEVNSMDYLLKPVEPLRLARALTKLDRPQISKRLLRELAASLSPRVYADRIASRTGSRVRFVDVGRVTHFYAHDRLTYAAGGGQNVAVDDAIAELEARLDPARFTRIHRSTLVNVDCIQEIEGATLRLKDGTVLVISRDRLRAVRELLGA